MPDIVLRLGVLLFATLLTGGFVWGGRVYVEGRRQKALTSGPLLDVPVGITPQIAIDTPSPDSRVRILAFSTAECRQCHQLQTPALQRVIAARGEQVGIVEIDATSETELTKRYHVLTVPTTVVLDSSGEARAVNYGFANTQKLLTQIDSLL